MSTYRIWLFLLLLDTVVHKQAFGGKDCANFYLMNKINLMLGTNFEEDKTNMLPKSNILTVIIALQ